MAQKSPTEKRTTAFNNQKMILPDASMCARPVMSTWQKTTMLLIAAGIALSVYYHSFRTLLLVNAIIIGFYLLTVAHKMLILLLSSKQGAEIIVSKQEIDALSHSDLPRYTLLVPLYREKETVTQLVQSISDLDYPKDKLEVLILLEETDRETIEFLATFALPPYFKKIVVPDSQPRTKPKACDIGLHQATGDYLVIYDAEDRPETDQLKKAVAAFKKCPPEVVCLQAKLNFYNPYQNIITKWFTSEYSMWFDLYLPGLSFLKAPIPLGGTSNHFIVSALKEVGGWDPYNVAEDCDLGIRLYRKGYSTRMIDSVTWEEACGNFGYWIRQRSRWIKGYMQTFFVHNRNVPHLLTQLNPARFLHFQLLTGGMFLCYLFNPVYWVLTFLWILFRFELSHFFPTPVFIMGFICLFLGNFAFIYGCMIGSAKRGDYLLIKYLILVPVYWMMMSLAAWKAFGQLFFKPYYWEKTFHGFSVETSHASDEMDPTKGGGTP